jgi:glycosyltransferase involved in cell wall biosynthesis
LAEKILFLLKNPNLSLQMGREGRKRVEDLFSLDNMIAKLEGIYRDLVNQEVGQRRPDPESRSGESL